MTKQQPDGPSDAGPRAEVRWIDSTALTNNEQADVFDSYTMGQYGRLRSDGARDYNFGIRVKEVALGESRLADYQSLDFYHVARDVERMGSNLSDDILFAYRESGQALPFRCGDDAGSREWTSPSLLVFDLAKQAEVISVPGTFTRLTMPRRLVANALGDVSQIHGLSRSDILANIFGDHLRSVITHARDGQDLTEVNRITEMLLAATLAPNKDHIARAEDPIHASLYARACRYIDKELLSETLTPDSMALGLGISRRRLYQAFEPAGGVAKTIMARRLEHAHAVLADRRAFQRVKEVAYSHGFKSDAHFARCFKQRFGYRPGETAERTADDAALRPWKDD